MIVESTGLRPEDLPRAPLVLKGISSRFIREYRVIPIELKNNVLKVLMSDPSDEGTIDAIRVAAGTEVTACAGDLRLIEDYLARYYGPDQQEINKIIENIDALEFRDEEDVGHLKDLASEAPIIKLVNLVITRAVESRASDIHLEPYSDELRIRYRIDGVLHDIDSAPRKLQAAIISRVKILAKLNIAERRLPQDGRIRLRAGGREIDLRISVIPVLYGESVVMRILDRESIVIDLDRLGFSPDMLERFHRLIQKPNGIILVTGPTGSGKTTTLYGALDKINSPDKKIITVEDPVEYQLKGINQIQTKPQIGLNFAGALRHIVRQDPDIIMIGEIRDLETAEIAIQSALTGHLVFSTLHTNDAPESLTRLLDIGVENFLLASTVRGILAQRLVRKICSHCGGAGESDDEGPRGCEKCSFTGFRGRTGIFELLAVDERIRRLILDRADPGAIRTAAAGSGMKTLLQDGMEKAAAGMTTRREVLRVTQEA